MRGQGPEKGWRSPPVMDTLEMSDEQVPSAGEENANGHSVKTWVRKQELRRYLGDALIRTAVDWPEEGAEGVGILEVVDQVIKWPNALVPVVRNDRFHAVVEQKALTDEIAKIFIDERRRTSN